MSLLAIHDCHFLEMEAEEPHLVLAKVAGYDTAAYGLQGIETFPLLFEHPNGRVMVSATKLSQFVTARYAPREGMQAVWQAIILSCMGTAALPGEDRWDEVLLQNINPHFPALRSSPRLRPARRSGPTAGSGATRQKQIPGSKGHIIPNAMPASRKSFKPNSRKPSAGGMRAYTISRNSPASKTWRNAGDLIANECSTRFRPAENRKPDSEKCKPFQTKKMGLFPSLTFVALMVMPLAQLHAAEYYASPAGNDANPGTAAKPFGTLERARDAVRTARSSAPSEEAMTVWLQGVITRWPSRLC